MHSCDQLVACQRKVHVSDCAASDLQWRRHVRPYNAGQQSSTGPGRAELCAHMQVEVLLSLTVQLYKLYFSTSKVFLMKDLHGQVEQFGGQLAQCSKGDLCAYKFFRGMLEVRRSCLRVCAAVNERHWGC